MRVPELTLENLASSAYGWPLHQLNVPKAHRLTRGSNRIVVAVIDLGYRFHPEHEGHLWVNPKPERGDIHGWDFVEDDETLEYNGPLEDSQYMRDHHAFVVGEVISVAPNCPIMALRVGYERQESWAEAINYAVEKGANILIIPHGVLTVDPEDGHTPLFYRGTDFTYPVERRDVHEALDKAYLSGCLTFMGTADNRGRRVAAALPALDSVIAVGSTNREGKPADIACSSEYTEVAAPGGQRSSPEPHDHVWSTGGANDFVPMDGGCMAAGFAGAVAALVWSRFPNLENNQIRQVLRNTARGKGWNPYLGHGILDAYRAVRLTDDELTQKIKVKPRSAALKGVGDNLLLEVDVENVGVFDVERALVVAYNGDPLKPAGRRGNMKRPVILKTRQVGHTIVKVSGFESAKSRIGLTESGPLRELYVQAFPLDLGAPLNVDTVRIPTRSLKGRSGAGTTERLNNQYGH